ncbi:uncharacterized protein TM35_000241120 [Trypanosoma theileri]|uniref:Uncharacterized protein n=1 Tax=Trypanosoma theileri TaxID=67003 RepID=A0A1X0NQG5_9TRYP|nr:uncharacterized protein TM35_000241120 [Trypanosoma theileri]ORC86962.1 hypothetical protein TM35_000241120 [Trypanosoma theileri]
MGSPSRKKTRKEGQVSITKKNIKADKEEIQAHDDDILYALKVEPEPEQKEIRDQGTEESISTDSDTSDSESELLAEGENLTGAALRDFLQHNFLDYIDKKSLCFTDLEEMDV